MPSRTRAILMRDVQVSEDAANRVGILLDSIERVMAREQERLQAEAERQLEAGTLDPPTPSHSSGVGVFPQLPDEQRWRVMVLGASVEDMNLWIRRDDQDGGRWYTLTEVETGTEAGGVEPLEACENYFRADVMDHVSDRLSQIRIIAYSNSAEYALSKMAEQAQGDRVADLLVREAVRDAQDAIQRARDAT